MFNTAYFRARELITRFLSSNNVPSSRCARGKLLNQTTASKLLTLYAGTRCSLPWSSSYWTRKPKNTALPFLTNEVETWLSVGSRERTTRGAAAH